MIRRLSILLVSTALLVGGCHVEQQNVRDAFLVSPEAVQEMGFDPNAPLSNGMDVGVVYQPDLNDPTKMAVAAIETHNKDASTLALERALMFRTVLEGVEAGSSAFSLSARGMRTLQDLFDGNGDRSVVKYEGSFGGFNGGGSLPPGVSDDISNLVVELQSLGFQFGMFRQEDIPALLDAINNGG